MQYSVFPRSTHNCDPVLPTILNRVPPVIEIDMQIVWFVHRHLPSLRQERGNRLNVSLHASCLNVRRWALGVERSTLLPRLPPPQQPDGDALAVDQLAGIERGVDLFRRHHHWLQILVEIGTLRLRLL